MVILIGQRVGILLGGLIDKKKNEDKWGGDGGQWVDGGQ